MKAALSKEQTGRAAFRLIYVKLEEKKKTSRISDFENRMVNRLFL